MLMNVDFDGSVKGLSMRSLDELQGKIAKEIARRENNRVELDAAENEFMLRGKRLAAIKAYRFRTGCTLLDAKETVERQYPYAQPVDK